VVEAGGEASVLVEVEVLVGGGAGGAGSHMPINQIIGNRGIWKCGFTHAAARHEQWEA